MTFFKTKKGHIHVTKHMKRTEDNHATSSTSKTEKLSLIGIQILLHKQRQQEKKTFRTQNNRYVIIKQCSIYISV